METEEDKELKARIDRLERVAESAKAMVGALNNPSDYETWSRLLSKLEKDLDRL